jgi:hypothetical protein
MQIQIRMQMQIRTQIQIRMQIQIQIRMQIQIRVQIQIRMQIGCDQIHIQSRSDAASLLLPLPRPRGRGSGVRGTSLPPRPALQCVHPTTAAVPPTTPARGADASEVGDVGGAFGEVEDLGVFG